MGGGGGSGNSTSRTYIRYNEEIEDKHEWLLEVGEFYLNSVSLNYNPYTLVGSSDPWTRDAVDTDDINDLIYGAGYGMSSFSSMFDMFGDYMSGVDLRYLFSQSLDDAENASIISAMTNAHGELLSDDLEQVILPRFRSGMRDIGAVQSSTFVVGESIIEQGRLKKLAEFDAKARYAMIEVGLNFFIKRIAFNTQLVSTYLDIIKFALATELEVSSYNYEIRAKCALWPWTIIAQHRAAIGAMQAGIPTNTSAESAGSSRGQAIMGGAMSGAATGAMIGSIVPGIGTGIGAVAGGVIGGIGGMLSS